MSSFHLVVRLDQLANEATYDLIDNVPTLRPGMESSKIIVRRDESDFDIVDGKHRTAGMLRWAKENNINIRELGVSVVTSDDKDLLEQASKEGPGQDVAIAKIYADAESRDIKSIDLDSDDDDPDDEPDSNKPEAKADETSAKSNDREVSSVNLVPDKTDRIASEVVKAVRGELSEFAQSKSDDSRPVSSKSPVVSAGNGDRKSSVSSFVPHKTSTVKSSGHDTDSAKPNSPAKTAEFKGVMPNSVSGQVKRPSGLTIHTPEAKVKKESSEFTHIETPKSKLASPDNGNCKYVSMKSPDGGAACGSVDSILGVKMRNQDGGGSAGSGAAGGTGPTVSNYGMSQIAVPQSGITSSHSRSDSKKYSQMASPHSSGGEAKQKSESGLIQNPVSRQVVSTAMQDKSNEIKRHEERHSVALRDVDSDAKPQYKEEQGPDGRKYAVAGEVNTNVVPVPGNAKATEKKADAIYRSAMHDEKRSKEDNQVARQAMQMKQEAGKDSAGGNGNSMKSPANEYCHAGSEVSMKNPVLIPFLLNIAKNIAENIASDDESEKGTGEPQWNDPVYDSSKISQSKWAINNKEPQPGNVAATLSSPSNKKESKSKSTEAKSVSLNSTPSQPKTAVDTPIPTQVKIQGKSDKSVARNNPFTQISTQNAMPRDISAAPVLNTNLTNAANGAIRMAGSENHSGNSRSTESESPTSFLRTIAENSNLSLDVFSSMSRKLEDINFNSESTCRVIEQLGTEIERSNQGFGGDGGDSGGGDLFGGIELPRIIEDSQVQRISIAMPVARYNPLPFVSGSFQ